SRAHVAGAARRRLRQRGERAGPGTALQRLRRRAHRALAHALRRFWHGADVENAGRARRDRPFARRAQVRRRLAVCELRRKFPRRSGVRSSARDAERARRGRVRPPRPASLEQGAGAALARLHDGVFVRHHARGGEPDFLRRDRAFPARSFHSTPRRRARALFRLAAFSVADDRPAPAAARARAGLRRLKRFWYDNALSPGEQTFGALDHVASPERVVFGTDFPFANPRVIAEMVKTYESGFLSQAR